MFLIELLLPLLHQLLLLPFMNEKIKNIIVKEKSEKERIEKWQAEKLDDSQHVRYDPNSKAAKSHFDAIMADVNESEQKVKNNLRTDKLAHDILNADSELLHILEGMALNSEADIKRIKSHREELKRIREIEIEKAEKKNKD